MPQEAETSRKTGASSKVGEKHLPCDVSVQKLLLTSPQVACVCAVGKTFPAPFQLYNPMGLLTKRNHSTGQEDVVVRHCKKLPQKTIFIPGNKVAVVIREEWCPSFAGLSVLHFSIFHTYFRAAQAGVTCCLLTGIVLLSTTVPDVANSLLLLKGWLCLREAWYWTVALRVSHLTEELSPHAFTDTPC